MGSQAAAAARTRVLGYEVHRIPNNPVLRMTLRTGLPSFCRDEAGSTSIKMADIPFSKGTPGRDLKIAKVQSLHQNQRKTREQQYI